MRRRFFTRVRTLLAAGALFAAGAAAGMAQETAPAVPSPATPPAAITAFAPGERLEYRIRWGLVTAGSASLQVLHEPDHGGVPAYRFSMAAATTPFLDTIYKVRDTFDSWVSTDLRQSLEYRQDQEEGSHRRRLRVTYDPVTLTALRIFNEKGNPPLPIRPGTFDPLGAMYAVRAMPDLKTGQDVTLPISDGKVIAQGRGRIVKEETITTPAGTFSTLCMEPELAGVKGVFEKSSGAKIHIWFTKDRHHLPVRVSSKIIIGSFTAELVSVTPGSAAAVPPVSPVKPPPPNPVAATP